MPGRFTCTLIVLAWLGAVGLLVQRDLLPRWRAGDPPRVVVARAITDLDGPLDQIEPPRSESSRWSLLVGTDLQPIGELTTESEPRDIGGSRLSSRLELDSAALLAKTPFGGRLPLFGGTAGFESPAPSTVAVADPETPPPPTRLVVRTQMILDREGSMVRFETRVGDLQGNNLLTMKGLRQGLSLEVQAETSNGVVLFREKVPYAQGAGVQNGLGPYLAYRDLKVGQSWRGPVVNPLTSSVQTAQVEVKEIAPLVWNGRPHLCHVIVSTLGPIVARTWVRVEDGVVLRQDVPVPFIKLTLERIDDPAQTETQAPETGSPATTNGSSDPAHPASSNDSLPTKSSETLR
jgi:hypothetical protein